MEPFPCFRIHELDKSVLSVSIKKAKCRNFKPRTQNLVLCSGVQAHLWERQRGLLPLAGHHASLMGVSQQHLDLFKHSHQLGRVTYFV